MHTRGAESGAGEREENETDKKQQKHGCTDGGFLDLIAPSITLPPQIQNVEVVVACGVVAKETYSVCE